MYNVRSVRSAALFSTLAKLPLIALPALILLTLCRQATSSATPTQILRSPPTAMSPSVSQKSSHKVPLNLSPLWTTRRDMRVCGLHLFHMSLSEAAGHASFIFLGLGYLESDVLPLRVYAAAGISCSIAFQYFRLNPLWIPISWNTIFLGINAIMVGVLLKEESDARRQDVETASIYDQVFREAGLTVVDFMKLSSISSTNDVPSGHMAARDGVTQTRLYVVVKGKLDVLKHGETIAAINEGEFVGEVRLP